MFIYDFLCNKTISLFYRLIVLQTSLARGYGPETCRPGLGQAFTVWVGPGPGLILVCWAGPGLKIFGGPGPGLDSNCKLRAGLGLKL